MCGKYTDCLPKQQINSVRIRKGVDGYPVYKSLKARSVSKIETST